MMEDRAGMFWMNKGPRCLINVFNAKRIMSNPQVSYQICSGELFFYFVGSIYASFKLADLETFY